MMARMGAKKGNRRRRRWSLGIDGVSTRRGGFTRIASALKFKAKNCNQKGRSSKAHTFVMGRGTDFEAFERYVDLVLLSFLSQEWRRLGLLEETHSRRLRGEFHALRTRGMRHRLDEEAAANALAYVARCLKAHAGRRELRCLFPAIRVSA